MPINPFLKLFGASPLEPMQQHMRCVYRCAEHLLPLFQAVLDGHWTQVEQLQQDISTLEDEADQLKRSIRQQLPKSLFLPVSRSDLLELLSLQDKVANRARDIAALFPGRVLQVPLPLHPELMAALHSCLSVCNQALQAVQEFDALLEAGFAGREVNLVREMVHTLRQTERETQQLLLLSRKTLFPLESQLSAVDVMHLYQVLGWIGEMADLAKQVGNQLEQLMIR